jgi:hypothetical protein
LAWASAFSSFGVAFQVRNLPVIANGVTRELSRLCCLFAKLANPILRHDSPPPSLLFFLEKAGCKKMRLSCSRQIQQSDTGLGMTG